MSRSSLAASVRSFFNLFLRHGISVGDYWTRFSSAKAELMKQPLTLPNAQMHLKAQGQVMAKKLSVPEVLSVSQFARRQSQISFKPLTDTCIQHRWTARALDILEPCKSAFFKAMNPILYGARAVAEKMRYLGTAIAGTYQQDAVKFMIISGFIRSQNFLLHRNSYNVRFFDFKLAHIKYILLPAISIAEKRNMRNYLCRFI
jgi:hypothetical protein